MTVDEFNALNNTEQEEILFNTAVFISNYDGLNLVTDIYQLQNFFVECCYHINSDAPALIIACYSFEELPCFKLIKPPPFSDN